MKSILFFVLLLCIVAPVIAAFPPPVVDFTANETNVCTFDVIQFTDDSVYYGIPSFFWDFGDSQDSHIENPTHYYDTAGTYDVYHSVQDKWGTGFNDKEKYIIVRDCSNGDFTANSTCTIGAPKIVQFNSTCYGIDLGKTGWTISPFPGWTYWNGTHWVTDNDGTFTTDLSGTLDPQINFTSYGSYTVTQACNYGAVIGTVSTTKTDFIKVGVNGTYCSGTCGGSGMIPVDWAAIAVVCGFIPIWLLIVGIGGKP